MLKTCSKTVITLATGIFLGALLLCGVYLLPVDSMQQHVQDSLEILVEEGENPFLMAGYKGSSLDNYTDALMLANASYESQHPFYKAAMLVERNSSRPDQPIASLQDYIEREEIGQVQEYSRYWHGYLVLLKPLLLFMDYGQIRILNGVVFIIVMLLAMAGFVRRKMWRGLIAFVLSMLTLFPVTIPYSLQFSTVFYTGMIPFLCILYKYELLKKRQAFIWIFLITGMVTSYMDYLTYPIFSLGMPLVLCFVLHKNSLLDKIKDIIQNGMAWSIGYVVMWSGKWVVGSLLTGRNLFTQAFATVSLRLSHEVNHESVNAVWAALRNVYVFFNVLGVLLALILLVWIASGMFQYRKWLKKSSAWLLILLACMPVVWYCVTTNHSYIHYWYTFRNLSVSIFALAMIPEYLYQENKNERY